jgi:hypothetical protein
MGYTLGARRVYQMEICTLKVHISQKKFPKSPAEKGQGGSCIGKLYKNEIAIVKFLKTPVKSAAEKIRGEKK